MPPARHFILLHFLPVLCHHATPSAARPDCLSVRDGDVTVVTVTAAPSTPSEAPQFVSDDNFTSAVLNSTNFYRAEHNASDLVWNSSLATFAGNYLSRVVGGNSDEEKCVFEHSGGPYGENLALGCSDVTGCVQIWGEERRSYDFAKAEFSTETGHFTQLVWKNTSDVGCGRRMCGGGKGWYLVCEYWPAGNVVGYFKEMVQEPVEGASWRNGAAGGGIGRGFSVGTAAFWVVFAVGFGVW